MGQKVNPIGLRLGINRGWESVWFAKKKEYGKLLIEDYKIREYIKKNIVNSGVSHVIIERTAKKCIVTIHTSRPGFVIGKKGSDVDKIKGCIKITGYVNSSDDFVDQPKVINPASETLSTLFGNNGKHTRVAVSSNSLPLGVAVEIDAIFEI